MVNLSALPELLLSWLKGQGVGQSPAGQGEATALPFKPGQHYQGQVLEQLANGRNLVRVGREVLDMALPKEIPQGATVRLTYLHPGPRPTFLLNQAASAAQPVRLSETAQQVTALVRYAQSPVAPTAAAAPATAATGNAQPAAAPSSTVSQTAAAVSARPIVANANLLLGAGSAPANLAAAIAGRVAIPAMAMGSGQAVDGLRAALAPNTSLTAQGVSQSTLADGHALPQRLRQVVAESGLFYESHLSRWTRGEVSMEALRREPQARLMQQGGLPTGVPELRDMPDEAARFAGRQLLMLEGGPFVWQGQAWPGQWMQWLVEERAGDGQGPAEEEAQWRTELRLHLPRMGTVAAELRIDAQGLRIDIRAAEAHLDEVRAALPQLAERLRAVNLNLHRLAAEAIPDATPETP